MIKLADVQHFFRVFSPIPTGVYFHQWVPKDPKDKASSDLSQGVPLMSEMVVSMADQAARAQDSSIATLHEVRIPIASLSGEK
jgi:hypothetical protein